MCKLRKKGQFVHFGVEEHCSAWLFHDLPIFWLMDIWFVWNLSYYKKGCYQLSYTYLLMQVYGSVLMACLSRWGTAGSFRARVHSSVQFSCSPVSDSLQPHGLQHGRLPCPSPILRVYLNSTPSSQWCHPTISSSVIPFSSHLQSFPASGSFPTSQFFSQVAKVLEFQLQHQSFQWIFRTDFL